MWHDPAGVGPAFADESGGFDAGRKLVWDAYTVPSS